MKNRFFIVLMFIFTFLYGTPLSFAVENTIDPREAAVDRAIGGMEEGSRPLLPQDYAGKNHAHGVPGGNLSPSSDTRVTASTSGQNIVSPSAVGTGANIGGSTHETVSGGAGTDTTETSTGTITEPVTELTDGSTGPTTEPANNTSTGIINADANIDLSGSEPTVDANLAIDTNADTLLDADASATTDTTTVDTSVTESGTIAEQDLTTTVNEAPVDAALGAEVMTTDVPAESEATAGLEADVDPVTADSDVTLTDPADGLSTGL